MKRSLLDYWLIVYQRRVSVFVVIITAVVTSLVIGEVVPPIYEARAALYIPAKLAPVSYVTRESASSLARQQNVPIQTEDGYKPYVGILKSRQLAQMVHEQFPEKPVFKLMRSDVDFEVTDELIVRVYSRDRDPQLAANVANAYVAGLKRILADASQAQVAHEPAYISTALAGAEGELRAAEAALKRFEEKYHVASLQTEVNALASRKVTLQDRLEETTVSIAANLGKRNAVIEEMKREGQDFEASEASITSPLIENLRERLAEVLARLAELEAELGKNNLTIVAQEKRRQDIEARLSEEVRKWVTSRIKPTSSQLEKMRQQFIEIAVEAQRLGAARKGYLQALERLNELVRRYPEIKAQWNVLNENVERIRSQLQTLRSSLTEARLQSERNMELLVQLDRAEPPGQPAFPIWWLNLLIALFGGMLTGIGYAFFLDYVDETRQVRIRRLVTAIVGRNADGTPGGASTS
jgi:uncharacterized protein involved in exopolysaccharide biosynthesis